ncbi:MAG: hypothetical protein GC160_07670 [Acidobacteria bacterium]|nr:hypothetical protein [Acidobacteriota bacterium]
MTDPAAVERRVEGLLDDQSDLVDAVPSGMGDSFRPYPLGRLAEDGSETPDMLYLTFPFGNQLYPIPLPPRVGVPRWRAFKAWRRVGSERGFDDQFIASQTVPLDETRTVELGRDGYWVFERRQGSKVIHWQMRGRQVIIQGAAPGYTVLTAMNRRGRMVGDLVVSVKEQRPVRLGVIRLICYRDMEHAGSGDPPLREPKRTLQGMRDVIRAAEEILQPQTNVRLLDFDFREIGIAGDLGFHVTYAELVENVLSELHPAAQLTVVLVWNLERKELKDPHGDEVLGVHLSYPRGGSTGMVAVQDLDLPGRGDLGKVLAHEVGHWLLSGKKPSSEQHSRSPGDLMYFAAEEKGGLKSGTTITREEADLMNPSGAAPDEWFHF